MNNDFITEANIIHNNYYNYSKVNYVNSRTKITIICPIHGEFEQFPRKHLDGNRCKKCANEHVNDYKKIGLDDFIERANKIHNNKYDYNLVKFSRLSDNINISCPEHGTFVKSAASHLRGRGCPKCNTKPPPIKQNKSEYSLESFIKRAATVHDGKYDYSKSIYQDANTEIDIICHEHGLFKIVVNDHLCGDGCPLCHSATIADLVTTANKVHNNRYKYRDDGSIVCPIHGSFFQDIAHHLRGQGCPKCHLDSGRSGLVDLINGLGLSTTKYSIGPFVLDIFIPSAKIGIGFSGLYSHSFDRLESADERLFHVRRLSAASDAGIGLIQVFESDWSFKNNIIKSIITNRLGKSWRIFARKLSIKELSDGEAKSFYDSSHLMGHRQSALHLALVDGDSVMCCMSFSKHHQFEFELMRFANAVGVSVVGGASRLFSRFLNLSNASSVLSYADRRYTTGGMYFKLGFELSGISDPNYCYVLGNSVFSRQQFQKHKLQNRLKKFDHELSGSANMFLNGYRRLWDAGHSIFLWRK